MRELSAINLLSELDKIIPEERLILLLGEEAYLKEQIVQKFTEKIFGDRKNGFDFIKLSGSELTIPEYINFVTTPPFSNYKLIVIKNGEDLQRQTLSDILKQSIPEFTKVIIITSKEINTTRTDTIIVKDYTMPMNQVEMWIEKKTKENGKIISKEATRELIKRLDTNFYLLSSEIKKLSMYIEDRKEIKIEDVKEIVKEIPEDDIFGFVDAIMFDKREKALNLLDYFLKSNNQENIVLYQILRTFSTYLIVNDLKNKEKHNLKEINDYLKNIFGTYLRRQTLEEIIRNLDKINISTLLKQYVYLTDLDVKSKTGEIDLPLALRNFVLTKLAV